MAEKKYVVLGWPPIPNLNARLLAGSHQAAGCVAEYKYVVLGPDGRSVHAWQPGANNVLALRQREERVQVLDSW